MPLYLGLDVSTQSVSAIVIEAGPSRRRIVWESSLNFDRDLPEYGTRAGVHDGPRPGEVTSPPLMWADGLDRMMARVAGALGHDVSRVRAVSGSAQQHGSVYLHRRAADVWRALDPAAPLAPQLVAIFTRAASPVWMDTSTSAACAAIEGALGGPEAAARLTGSRVYERFTGPQIRAFAERDPEAYGATSRIHLVSSYLASLLAGEDSPIDPGDGSGMNLMSLATSEWAPEALAATAPRLTDKLPPIRPSWSLAGTLAPYWQRRYGFPALRVVLWSGDNPCSLVGTGAVVEGQLVVSLGTSDTVCGWSREPRHGVSHTFAAPIGGYMSLVCFRNGSLARERIRDEHGLEWQGFSRALEHTTAGNSGAMMLPWFDPEITPRAPAGVVRHRLDPHDGPANVRGVVEAQMMAMANHGGAITNGVVSRLVATGGGSTNRALLQVMADVFGVPVCQLAVENTACLGAALRACHADRLAEGDDVRWPEIVRGFTDPMPDRIVPAPANVALYRRLRVTYAAFERGMVAMDARQAP